MPKLILKEKGSDAEKVLDFEREEISLGRANINGVILEGGGVSRRHAKIIPEGRDFYIIDLGSAGGTKINGLTIPANEKYILKNNDLINIDQYDIKFQTIDELLTQSFNEITDSDILEVKLLKKVLRALDRESIPSFEVLNGTSEGKKAFVTEDVSEITIGREPMCDFQIEEYVISRKHAKIIKKWGGIIIQDLGSKNGVYVNNRRVAEEFLHDGDRIALGTIVLMFRNPKEIDIAEISKQMTKEKKAAEDAEAKTREEAKKGEIKGAAEEKGKATDEDEVSSTGKELSEEEQKELVEKVQRREYPAPQTKRQKIRFTSIELSLIGVGALVFIFAIIMIVRVLFS